MPRRRKNDAPYWVALRQCERQIIEAALDLTGGVVAEAARRLGIHTTHLWGRIGALQVSVEIFRERAKARGEDALVLEPEVPKIYLPAPRPREKPAVPPVPVDVDVSAETLPGWLLEATRRREGG